MDRKGGWSSRCEPPLLLFAIDTLARLANDQYDPVMTTATQPVAALAFLLLVSTSVRCLANTGRIGPSFACPRPAPADGLSQIIWDDPDMSRSGDDQRAYPSAVNVPLMAVKVISIARQVIFIRVARRGPINSGRVPASRSSGSAGSGIG